MPTGNLRRRITSNPEIFGGKPIIRGLRISVELILGLLAQGESIESLVEDYPDLTATTSALVWSMPGR
jgi:uncharacterized protein (DUF433 family)